MTLQELAVYKTADEGKRREIESYIAEIPDPQTREMFRLHFIGGYSYSETARKMGGGVTRYCVFSRVKRYVKRHLKKLPTV